MLTFYDRTRKEYFFDRDPKIFRHVLSFYQVGKLHLSYKDCVESFRDELKFYGISNDVVHECCWDECHETTAKTSLYKPNRHKNNCNNLPGSYSDSRFEVRKQIYDLLERGTETRLAKVIQYSIGILICLSVCCAVVASLRCGRKSNWEQCYRQIFEIFDAIFMSVFTVEYLLRLFSSPKLVSFLKDKFNVLDLAAILPFYSEVFMRLFVDTASADNTDALDIFRVLRVIRIFKLARHSKHIRKFGSGLKKAVTDLGFLYFAFFLANIFFASLLYSVEALQGCETFQSISESMWYSVVTMMTLGYGDIVPESIAGKIIGAFCCIFGIIILALPVPILQDVGD